MKRCLNRDWGHRFESLSDGKQHQMNGGPSCVIGNAERFELIFPENGQVRARKVATRSRSRTKGKLPSWKAGRMLEYESINERNVFIHLEVDPTVLLVGEQPCRILYMDSGVRKVHYPDVLVSFRTHKEFWEIKSAAEANDSDILHRTQVMRQLSSLGYGYRLAIAEEFSVQPRLQNSAKLLQFGQRPVAPHEREALRVYLAEHGTITWLEASVGLLGTRSREVLCRLVMEGHLSFGLELPWNRESVFSPTGTL